ncbi:TatD family hydrolase [Schleiferilactobacillus harbinensis]|uniref:TatD family hydrolase n=1 Tax=Schleiferilactobacillus harbinensis TaxID=304207 RepID=UPI00168B1B18|nr:TatD family hydrolase [Schleiferilactobacillus harbinensis]
MIDSHFHIAGDTGLLTHLAQHHVAGIVNSQNPTEWAAIQQWQDNHPAAAITVSAGVHPWDVDRLTPGAMKPFLTQAPVIGEIGLDTAWTKNPLSQQRVAFVQQLAWARDWHKPVILHTKGAEKEILSTIRQFPNRYYVHWYDSPNYLADYLRLDTYFSVGPSLGLDPTVTGLAETVPLDRLLLESDGLESITWATGQKADAYTDYDRFMTGLLTRLAQLRGLPPTALADQLRANLTRFLAKE